MSGGQQQRVALARALVNRPTVLLLDEPLGALDLKLRKEMQLELKALQREVGITFVYVTHDQEEALTMSDVIVVMRDGRIQQQGDPTELYERPVNRFVAEFIGTSNFLRGDGHEPSTAAAGTSPSRRTSGLDLRGVRSPILRPGRRGRRRGDGRHPAGTARGRPGGTERRREPRLDRIPGRIQQGTYLGDQTEFRVQTEQAGEAHRPPPERDGRHGRASGLGPGDPVTVRWQEEANLVLAG